MPSAYFKRQKFNFRLSRSLTPDYCARRMISMSPLLKPFCIASSTSVL